MGSPAPVTVANNPSAIETEAASTTASIESQSKHQSPPESPSISPTPSLTSSSLENSSTDTDHIPPQEANGTSTPTSQLSDETHSPATDAGHGFRYTLPIKIISGPITASYPSLLRIPLPPRPKVMETEDGSRYTTIPRDILRELESRLKGSA